MLKSHPTRIAVIILLAIMALNAITPFYTESLTQGWTQGRYRFIVWQDQGDTLTPEPVDIDSRIDAIASLVESLGGVVVDRISLFNAIVVESSYNIAPVLESLGYNVTIDARIPQKVSEAVASSGNQGPRLSAIGASNLHSQGITGKGVIVAIVGSGIQNEHPALADPSTPTGSAVVWEFDATQTGVKDYCGSNTGSPPAKSTQLAGIVASRDPDYMGVAPGALLYDIIVFPDVDGCNETQISWLLKGFEAAVLGPDGQLGTGDDADIILFEIDVPTTPWAYAYGGPGNTGSAYTLLRNAYQILSLFGLQVVGPAGDRGPGLYTVNAFCIPGLTICAAASSDSGTPDPGDDVVSSFSSRGPHFMLYSIGPTLAAPGEGVVAPVPTELGSLYAPITSSAAAAAHVAGSLALLIDGLGETYKRFYGFLLANTAVDIGSSLAYPGPVSIEQGSGLIRVDRALSGKLVASSQDLEPNATVIVVEGSTAAIPIYITNISNGPVNVSISTGRELINVMNGSREGGPSIRASPSQVLVSEGQSTRITLMVDTWQASPGIYSAMLRLADDSGGKYIVPVMISVAMKVDPQTMGGTIRQAQVSLGRSMGFDTVAVPIYIPTPTDTTIYLSALGPFPAEAIIQHPDFRTSKWLFKPSSEGFYAVYLTVLTATAELDAIAKLESLGSGGSFTLFIHIGMEDKVNSLAPRVALLEKQVGQLSTTVESLESSFEGLERSVSSLLSRVKSVEDRLYNLESLTNSLSHDITSLRTSIEDLDSRARSIENSLQDAVSALDSLQAEVSSLKERVERVEGSAARISQIQDRLESVETSIQALEEELNTISTETSKIADEANNKLTLLEESLTALSARINQVEDSQAMLQADIDSVKSVLSTTEKVLEAIRTDIEALSSRLGELQSRLGRAESSIQAVKGDIESLKMQLDEQDNKIEKSVEELRDSVESSSGSASLALGVSSVAALLGVLAIGIGVYLARRTML